MMFWKVKLPSSASKLRTKIETEGRNRNMKANRKKGTNPSQAHENGFWRGDAPRGASPSCRRPVLCSVGSTVTLRSPYSYSPYTTLRQFSVM